MKNYVDTITIALVIGLLVQLITDDPLAGMIGAAAGAFGSAVAKRPYPPFGKRRAKGDPKP